jgi:solute carrier family 25 folate transporter 32
MQDKDPIRHKQYSGFVKTVLTVLRQEGIKGFYRGLSTNLIRSIPAAVVTFTSYEEIRKTLEHHYTNER